MTAASLNSYTVKDLAQMARRRGVQGWHSMRKDALVQALVKAEKNGSSNGKAKASKNGVKRRAAATASAKAKNSTASRSGSANGAAKRKPKETRKPAKKVDPKIARRIHRTLAQREQRRDLAAMSNGKSRKKSTCKPRDRVVLMVHDAFWLHAYWEFTRQAVDRARAALAEQWHTAKPVLRVMEVRGGSITNTAESLVRDIPIHGGVRHWYIDVQDSPKSYRVVVGYLAENGKFHTLARSNSVTTPRPGANDPVDENWSNVMADGDRIFALSGGFDETQANGDLQEIFEEKLQRPLGGPMATQFGAGASGVLPAKESFAFEVDAEVIVYGQTRSDAYVTLSGEPVKLRDDGTFSVRMNLPDSRQVLPVVAQSADGREQRTTVLSLNRNTKTMEPVIRDPAD
jgi:hypothetical protein